MFRIKIFLSILITHKVAHRDYFSQSYKASLYVQGDKTTKYKENESKKSRSFRMHGIMSHSIGI